MDVLSKIEKTGLIPVIVINDIKNAVPLARALRAGGLNAAEITFRTPCAAEALKAITTEFPDMLAGAGTVLNSAQAAAAAENGAVFIVSPGFNPEVVEYCLKNNIPVIPGCSCPSDIERAISAGLGTVKFFPAEACGGINMLNALGAPYNVKFMPTGGINASNLAAYTRHKKVAACGGSFMVNEKLLAEENYAEITRLTSEAVGIMHGFTLAHIGINTENAAEAEKTAGIFGTLFNFAVNGTSASYFAGPVEVMKTRGRGKNGHIAVGVNSVERAVYFLENNGFKFDYGSAAFSGGKMIFIYLTDEIAGFALHLRLNQ